MMTPRQVVWRWGRSELCYSPPLESKMPYVLPDQRDWTSVVSALGVFARRARAERPTVACHHHDFEFEITGGARPFDRPTAGRTLG